MSYSLGLDLGTTNSAVAIADDQGIRMLPLGTDGPIVSSVIHVTADGVATFGQPALRRGESDPAGVAREFKRRFGDTTPFLLHGTPVAANDLTLQLAEHLVAEAARLLGAPPAELAVCHPANWGMFKTALLSDTLNNSSLPPHRLITEPEAAAIHYATQERVVDGTTIAVYDLGGGTFDVAILRKVNDGWSLLGRPGGIERLGGIDFDTAVFQHVISALDIDLEALDADDPTTQRAIGRLRSDCTEAKHALSADTSTTVSVLLPQHSQQVRVARSEFERLIRPMITRSLDTFDTTLAGAGLSYEDIDRVLMVGGSSRIPLVAEQVASHTGRPLATDAHPKHACALGAAALLRSSVEPVDPGHEPVPENTWPQESDPDLTPDTKLGGMFQDLPHISEGLPEFMDRGRWGHTASASNPRPIDSQRPVSPTSETPPPATPHPAAVPATRANPVLAPTEIRQRTLASTRPSPAGSPQRASRSASAFFIGLFMVLVLGGGAAYFLGLFDQDADSETSTPVTIAPGEGETDESAVNETNCPDDRIPDPGVDYRIKEIAADDRDGGANARTGPGLGPSTPPVTVLASFTPVELAPASCEVDADGRVWWGITVDGNLLWVAASLIVPVN